MLIAYNRGKMDKIKGTGFYKKYRDMSENKDLIVGSIANDRMFYVIDNFFNGNITDTALVNSLSALKLGKQYAVVTQNSSIRYITVCNGQAKNISLRKLRTEQEIS